MNHSLHSGVAKECARSVLPLNTVTRLYMCGTIRSWLHYVDLRGSNGTQREHMQIAASVGEISRHRTAYNNSRNVGLGIMIMTDKNFSHNEFYCCYCSIY